MSVGWTVSSLSFGRLTGVTIDANHDSPDRRLGELSAETSASILVAACSDAGLSVEGAELIRLGEHAVYRLRDRVVARVARAAVYEAEARREIEVARWLEAVEFPAPRALPIEQPVRADGSVVTFSESVADTTIYGSTTDVAKLLRRLHELDPPPATFDLPPLQPFGRVQRRIEEGHLATEDRAFLRSRLGDLQQAYEGLKFTLPPGAIHGDASVGNVIRHRDGYPVLIDLDSFATGPREWDLALTATYYDSFGWHTAEEYQEFVDVYGFDVMEWPGFPTLREIRELIMVSWLSQKAAENDETAAELRRRVEDLRTGASRRGWQPY